MKLITTNSKAHEKRIKPINRNQQQNKLQSDVPSAYKLL